MYAPHTQHALLDPSELVGSVAATLERIETHALTQTKDGVSNLLCEKDDCRCIRGVKVLSRFG